MLHLLAGELGEAVDGVRKIGVVGMRVAVRLLIHRDILDAIRGGEIDHFQAAFEELGRVPHRGFVREAEKGDAAFATSCDCIMVNRFALGVGTSHSAAQARELGINARPGRARGGEVLDAHPGMACDDLDEFEAGIAGGTEDGDGVFQGMCDVGCAMSDAECKGHSAESNRT